MRDHRNIERHSDTVELIRHELNTPVATALLYIGIAEHCASRLPGNLMMPALRVVRSEVQRLKALIDTVTELQRVGRAVLNPQLTDLTGTVRATVKRLLTTFAGTEGVAIVAPPRSLRGWWDPTAVEQIVSNLLSNALKFGQGRSVRVMVKAAVSGASITVRDHGTGISPADRLRIFERNAHAPAERGGGQGLGLWLVRELAIAHGGRVTVHSRRGRGTTFTVFLRPLPPAVGGLGQAAVTRLPPQRSPSPVRTVTYAAGSRAEAAADYWQDRVVRSQTKMPLRPRRETDVAAISTMISPSLTANLKASWPSRTRKSTSASVVRSGSIRPASRNRNFASPTLRGSGR
jgi:anti-sigma regulatory factor (Ser/Thr protein kinase)